MRILVGLFLVATAPFALALTPRITFERILPAAHDLGRVEEVALVSAPANDPHVEPFVERFLEQVHRSGLLRMRDARSSTGPADVHLDLRSITCQTATHEGEGSARDADGRRIKRRYFTAEASCFARIDVLTRVMKYRSTFYAKGAGISSRADEVGEEERRHAIADALRQLATDAAERITPRRVRESIPLDQTAPAFEAAFSLIEAERFAEARRLWEEELKRAPRNAALHYNLGAVCEALRDVTAAKRHYTIARELAPSQERYATELRLFSKRVP